MSDNVSIQQMKKEGSNTDPRAKITGLKTDAECPKTGKKTIYAASEKELRQSVQKRLDDAGKNNWNRGATKDLRP